LEEIQWYGIEYSPRFRKDTIVVKI